MASLSKLMLTIEQSEEHKKLQAVRIAYGYTLQCSKVDQREQLVYTVGVDILGDDLLVDDKLAQNVDVHEVVCGGGTPGQEEISIHREFVVGQKLLDEDVGIDEIKLEIRAVATTGESCSGMTGIVRGYF